MASINFYLDRTYIKGETKEEQQIIEAKIKEAKKNGQLVPKKYLAARETSIYLIVTLTTKLINAPKAKLVKIKTDYKISPKIWDFKARMPDKNGTGNLELTIWLEEIKTAVKRRFNEIVKEGKELSPFYIKQQLTPIIKKEEGLINTQDFFGVFDDYLRHKTKASAATLKKFRGIKNVLLEFQNYYGVKLTFDGINLDFKIEYETFLIQQKGYVNNTIEKHISEVRYFLKWAYKQNKHRNSYYENLIATKDLVEPISLEFEEFAKIVNYNSNNNRLAKIRDLFVFQCITGQRYGDIASIEWVDIKNNAIWELYQGKGHKTTKLEIPLHELAQKILLKYIDQPTPLPRLSNQKYNDGIKDLCRELSINQPVKVVRYSGSRKIESTSPKYELISTHIARKTFINLAPFFDMTIEIVMSITGHKNYKTIQNHYRKVSVTEKIVAIERIRF